jgi:hypothetical protein
MSASVGADAEQGDREVMGCSKNTVKRALTSDGPPRFERRSAGSVVDPDDRRKHQQSTPRVSRIALGVT